VVAGELGVVALHGGEPVLRCPAGGVGRVHRDDGQAGVAGHGREPVTEPGGGDPGDLVPERPAPASPCGPVAGVFASLVAGAAEAEVLDHDGAGPVRAGGGQDTSKTPAGMRSTG
jgi:hypothetical protein